MRPFDIFPFKPKSVLDVLPGLVGHFVNLADGHAHPFQSRAR